MIEGVSQRSRGTTTSLWAKGFRGCVFMSVLGIPLSDMLKTRLGMKMRNDSDLTTTNRSSYDDGDRTFTKSKLFGPRPTEGRLIPT